MSLSQDILAKTQIKCIVLCVKADCVFQLWFSKVGILGQAKSLLWLEFFSQAVINEMPKTLNILWHLSHQFITRPRRGKEPFTLA